MENIQVSVLGIIIAVIFTLSLGGVLWWMLHPPAQIKAEVAKARRALGALKRILVPTNGTSHAERAIELACRLGLEQQAEIVVVNVVEVPRTLPLEAPLPQAEQKAQEALLRGKEIVALHHLTPIVLAERAREASEGIIRAAKEQGADLVVLGLRTNLKAAQYLFGRTTETVVRRSPCEVVLDKLPE
jgi:nucleotide-binding universal stress UspA family protein